ncbi:hypothetical protein QEN19_002154 [Hanseniaspora menglaensis]
MVNKNSREYFLLRSSNARVISENDAIVSALLTKLKVGQLKILLGMYNLPKKGLKKDHIEALQMKWKELTVSFATLCLSIDNKHIFGAFYFYYIIYVIFQFPDDYSTLIPNGETFYQCCVEAPNKSLDILFARALIKEGKYTFANLNRKIFPDVTMADVSDSGARTISGFPPSGAFAQYYGNNFQNSTSNGISDGYRNQNNLSSNMDIYNNDTLALLNNFDYIKSPFFVKARSIKRQILGKSSIKKIEIIKFQLSQSDVERLNRLNTDSLAYSYEILLYCAPIKSMMSNNELISFPSPIEIKINSQQVSDYIRGIKNKPETAQPARLTEHIFKEVLKDNAIQITFLRTNFQYVCNVYLVKSYNGVQLYNRAIKINEHIDKPTTILKAQQILNEDDEELQMETMRMSLQCPISYSRMKFPVRSRFCNHIQCFDAQWYLEAQRQVPLWECPVCQVKLNLTDIRICDYTTEILNNCKNDNDEQVEIRKDGTYKYLENDNDFSDSDENSDGGGNEKSYFNNNMPKKKNELEPEVIVLISSDEEEEQERNIAPPAEENVISETNLAAPVLVTAESEDIVGNIATESQKSEVNDFDEEMPSLRNDGRDLTASLANHYILNQSNNKSEQSGIERSAISSSTQAASAADAAGTIHKNLSAAPFNALNAADTSAAVNTASNLVDQLVLPTNESNGFLTENTKKRRASTELTKETFIDLTGDD